MLFNIHSSFHEQGINITITFDTFFNNFSVQREPGSNTDFQLQTGIPHLITLQLVNNSIPTPSASYYGVLQEAGGYLILNPYTDSSPLTDTSTYHSWRIPKNTTVVVVPTSLGSINSNISFEIVNVNYHHVATLNATVVPALSLVQNGVDYHDDLLKTVVNAISQVLYSMYIALNT